MKVTIHEDLVGTIRLGVLRLTGITLPGDEGETLWQDLEAACLEINERFSGLTSGQVPGVSEARRLYRAIGIDPTKTRPSSEALLRRILKGKGLYRIHPLVDLFNMASLTSLLPVGLYDESKIVGDAVTIRLGEEGWGFDGIRKDRVNVGGRLCVTDGEGPFGSPTSDSLRTSIEGNVKQVLAVFFQHAGGEDDFMTRALDKATDLARTYLNATIDERYVTPNRAEATSSNAYT